jgi:hypothetical protein
MNGIFPARTQLVTQGLPSRPVIRLFRLVGATGFEPVTPRL